MGDTLTPEHGDWERERERRTWWKGKGEMAGHSPWGLARPLGPMSHVLVLAPEVSVEEATFSLESPTGRITKCP